VNIDSLRGPALKHLFRDQLSELLESIDWLDAELREADMGPAGWDLGGTLHAGARGAIELVVVCKRQISPSQLEVLFASKRNITPPSAIPVLATVHVSERVARLCSVSGWGWIDLAGNAHLQVPGLLYLERTGKKPVARSSPRVANLGSPEAARMLRAILAPSNVSRRWTQRGLRDYIADLQPPLLPPSLGLINKIVRHLREEALVRSMDGGGFESSDPMGLLHAFSRAYRSDRVHQLDLFTLMQPAELQAALARLDLESGGCAAYAAFSAADRMAPMVGQSRTWVMVAARHERRLRELTGAKDVDSGSNLVALIPEDDGPFYGGEAMGSAPTLRCTSAVQTYLDLQHAGGRGVEAASAILETCLRPAWASAGLVGD